MLTSPKVEGITRTIPAGRTLYGAGEEATHAFLIHTGTIKILADPWVALHRGDHDQKDARLIEVAGPNDILGIHQAQHPHTAITASETLATIIDHKHLTRPDAIHLLLDYIAKRNARSQARLQQQDLPVPMRLVELMRDLAERFGDPTNPDISFTLPLTHGDLADLTSSSRVTITKHMAELAREGVLEGSRGTYTLHTQLIDAYVESAILK